LFGFTLKPEPIHIAGDILYSFFVDCRELLSRRVIRRDAKFFFFSTLKRLEEEKPGRRTQNFNRSLRERAVAQPARLPVCFGRRLKGERGD
jgi:hypothetical protein